MNQWVTEFIKAGGYLNIIFLMFIENVFPPIPSELIMPLAGYLSSEQELQFWLVVLAGTLGTVLGALPLYYLGRLLGRERLSRFSDKHGHWIGLKPRDIERSERWFKRYGAWTVFFLRVVPGLRSLISVPAGVMKMPMLTFLVFTTAGTLIWMIFLSYLGLQFGKNFENVERYIGPVSYVVFALCIALYIWKVVKGIRSNKAS